MLKSKKSITLDQNGAKMFAASAKRFIEAKELSVQEIASRIQETPKYVENILEGNVAVGLEDVMDLALALEVPINLLVYEYKYQNQTLILYQSKKPHYQNRMDQSYHLQLLHNN